MKSNLKAHPWKRRKLPQNTNLLYVLSRFDSKLKHLEWNLIWKHTFEHWESSVAPKHQSIVPRLTRFGNKWKHLERNLLWKRTFENGESCLSTPISCTNKVFEEQMLWETDWRSFCNRIKCTGTSNSTVTKIYVTVRRKNSAIFTCHRAQLFSHRWPLNYKPKHTQKKQSWRTNLPKFATKISVAKKVASKLDLQASKTQNARYNLVAGKWRVNWGLKVPNNTFQKPE